MSLVGATCCTKYSLGQLLCSHQYLISPSLSALVVYIEYSITGCSREEAGLNDRGRFGDGRD